MFPKRRPVCLWDVVVPLLDWETISDSLPLLFRGLPPEIKEVLIVLFP